MRCLAALARQDLDPLEYEIIVADDGEDEDTAQVVKWWTARAQHGGLRIIYVAVTGRHGPAAARNAGWKMATGEIIAFTDDDCIPATTWLSSGIAAFDCDLSAISGRIIMPLPSKPTDYERDAARLESAGFVTANCFCRRDVLIAQNGFDENFTAAWREDSDLLFTLLENHAMVGHAPKAIVEHPIRPAPWGISIRQQRKILFDALLYKKHPKLYLKRIRATPPWQYYITATVLFIALSASISDQLIVAIGAMASWLIMMGKLWFTRLKDTSHQLTHVLEMLVTSIVIPPLAIFWRLFGAVKFRVMYL